MSALMDFRTCKLIYKDRQQANVLSRRVEQGREEMVAGITEKCKEAA